MSLYTDLLLHISSFCNFETRINFKKSSKVLYDMIDINLLKDDDIIDSNFMKDEDNSNLLVKYFLQKYVANSNLQTETLEPYLFRYPPILSTKRSEYPDIRSSSSAQRSMNGGYPDYSDITDPRQIIYSQSPARILYEKIIKSETVLFFNRISKIWFYDDCNDRDDIVFEYTIKYLFSDIWDNMIRSRYTDFYCLYKLNSNSPNIQNGRYTGSYLYSDFVKI